MDKGNKYCGSCKFWDERKDKKCVYGWGECTNLMVKKAIHFSPLDLPFAIREHLGILYAEKGFACVYFEDNRIV